MRCPSNAGGKRRRHTPASLQALDTKAWYGKYAKSLVLQKKDNLEIDAANIIMDIEPG